MVLVVLEIKFDDKAVINNIVTVCYSDRYFNID